MSEKFVGFNLNNKIYFKVDQRTQQLYEKHYKSLFKDYPKVLGRIDIGLHPREDGFAYLPLWEFMEIFGKYMSISSISPCETRVFFNRDDIEDE